MVRAWYMDVVEADQREPHMTSPPKFVEVADLKKFGVNYWQLDTDNLEKEGKLAAIRKECHYDFEDEVHIARDKLPDYDNKLKMFFTEHIHSDDEVRLVTEGSGYFDIRDLSDHWIRIEVVKNYMISLPAGLYHRFTLDTKNFIIARRFFAGNPCWIALDRPQDDHPQRKKYLENFGSGSAAGDK